MQNRRAQLRQPSADQSHQRYPHGNDDTTELEAPKIRVSLHPQISGHRDEGLGYYVALVSGILVGYLTWLFLAGIL